MSKIKNGDGGMFCRQCEEARHGTGCVQGGACGKDKELSNAMDLLVETLISLSEAGGTPGADPKDIDGRIARGLFMTMTNANFDVRRIAKEAESNEALLPQASRKPARAGPPYDADPDLGSLKELLLCGVKGLAAYYYHATVLGHFDKDVEAFMRRGLAALRQNLSADDLVSLNMECGKVGAAALALLDKANTEAYGIPAVANVATAPGSRPGILVTGHDLKDLKMILEQSEGSGVDVYTHGEMLPAHAYPGLRAYGHLVGNYGNAWHMQRSEFRKFNGPIVATTNCVLLPDASYVGRLFTTGPAGIPGARHIPADAHGNRDFREVVEAAKRSDPPEAIDDFVLTVGFGHDAVLSLADKIVGAVKAGAIKRFVVMAGCDGREEGRSYYADFAAALPEDAVVLTAGCAKYRYNKLDLGDIGGIPRVIDAGQCNDCYSLVVIASALAEAFGTDVNGLPLSFNIAWYEQKACLVLLTLLSLGVKDVMLGPRLPEFVTPGVLKVLAGSFGIRANGAVDEDMKILNIGG